MVFGLLAPNRAGVHLPVAGGPPAFRHVQSPSGAELQVLLQQIAGRVGRLLERRGLVERDIENAWLAGAAEPGPLDDLIGHSVTYRIAVGPRAGQKLFALQTLPARQDVSDQQGEHRDRVLATATTIHDRGRGGRQACHVSR